MYFFFDDQLSGVISSILDIKISGFQNILLMRKALSLSLELEIGNKQSLTLLSCEALGHSV